MRKAILRHDAIGSNVSMAYASIGRGSSDASIPWAVNDDWSGEICFWLNGKKACIANGCYADRKRWVIQYGSAASPAIDGLQKNGNDYFISLAPKSYAVKYIIKAR